MELYQEILAKLLTQQKVEVVFPNLSENPEEMVKGECYKMLSKIKAILEDDSLTDQECFVKIEKIVCLFEEAGSGCKTRHDFGEKIRLLQNKACSNLIFLIFVLTFILR